jgi:outer membrane beta-barrel protein
MTPSLLALWLVMAQTQAPAPKPSAAPASGQTTAPGNHAVSAVPLPPPPPQAAPAAPAVPPSPAASALMTGEEEPPGNRSEPPALEDQLPTVSGQTYEIGGKFEITPGVGISFNDAFFQSFMPELAIGYHFSDPFYLGLRGGYAFSTSAGNVNSCTISNGAQVCGPPTSEQLKQLPGALKGSASLEGAWTPFAGKVNIFAEFVIHTDFSVLLGAGAMFVVPPEGSTNPSVAPMLSPGIGARFFFSESLALSLEMRDYMYESGGLTNQLMFNIGLAILL